MPRYDYKCNGCEAEMELEHPMSETRRKCPECSRMKLIRLITTAPAYHSNYSPMHPRAGRGRGGERGLPG